jgi:hypothetical protein
MDEAQMPGVTSFLMLVGSDTCMPCEAQAVSGICIPAFPPISPQDAEQDAEQDVEQDADAIISCSSCSSW